VKKYRIVCTLLLAALLLDVTGCSKPAPAGKKEETPPKEKQSWRIYVKETVKGEYYGVPVGGNEGNPLFTNLSNAEFTMPTEGTNFASFEVIAKGYDVKNQPTMKTIVGCKLHQDKDNVSITINQFAQDFGPFNATITRESVVSLQPPAGDGAGTETKK